MATRILPLIKARRSVRAFKAKTPSQKELEDILEAGRWAPSGLNNQPWRFLIVRDEKQREALSRLTRYGRIIRQAPALIIVCMDTGDSYNREKDLMAVGACIQNMLLEAWALRIGTCWLGEILNNKTKVSRLLALERDLDFLAVIALGYPDGKRGKGCRKPLNKLLIKNP